MQKKIKQFYYDKTMVHFCKGCDVNMIFVEENIEAVSSSKKVIITCNKKKKTLDTITKFVMVLLVIMGLYNGF